jgi:hypothetical protein
MADKAVPSQAFGLHPFENITAEPLDSWKLVNDDSATPYVKLIAPRITKHTQNGLKVIQPLQYRDRLMHEYTNAKDGMRCSEKELDPKIIEKRIRSLMKSPWKEPLKFGMAMFENGSCPLVCLLFRHHTHDICCFMDANIFSFPIFS